VFSGKGIAEFRECLKERYTPSIEAEGKGDTDYEGVPRMDNGMGAHRGYGGDEPRDKDSEGEDLVVVDAGSHTPLTPPSGYGSTSVVTPTPYGTRLTAAEHYAISVLFGRGGNGGG